MPERVASVCLSICPTAYPSKCSSVCLSVCLPACLANSLSVCLSVSLSACLSVCLSVCQSVCPSVRLSLSSVMYFSPLIAHDVISYCTVSSHLILSYYQTISLLFMHTSSKFLESKVLSPSGSSTKSGSSSSSSCSSSSLSAAAAARILDRWLYHFTLFSSLLSSPYSFFAPPFYSLFLLFVPPPTSLPSHRAHYSVFFCTLFFPAIFSSFFSPTHPYLILPPRLSFFTFLFCSYLHTLLFSPLLPLISLYSPSPYYLTAYRCICVLTHWPSSLWRSWRTPSARTKCTRWHEFRERLLES